MLPKVADKKMTKLLLEIKSNNPKLTTEIMNEFLLDKKFDFVWVESHEDLPKGKRKYFSSNRLSKNKITMDNTKYTNPELTRFECCMCLKIKPVSHLLVDYLGRCIQCKHR
jgi:hypothetical protein